MPATSLILPAIQPVTLLRHVRQGEMAENEAELAALQLEKQEFDDKMRAAEEEKEFMKSLMDDLLEQVAIHVIAY